MVGLSCGASQLRRVSVAVGVAFSWRGAGERVHLVACAQDLPPLSSIDPHATQIPARRASLFHLFFNLIFTLNQGTLSGGCIFKRGAAFR